MSFAHAEYLSAVEEARGFSVAPAQFLCAVVLVDVSEKVVAGPGRLNLRGGGGGGRLRQQTQGQGW